MKRYEIDPLFRFLLRWVCKKIVVQGPMHKDRITAYYGIMSEAAKREFCEDNKPTLDVFLKECFDSAVNASVDRTEL